MSTTRVIAVVLIITAPGDIRGVFCVPGMFLLILVISCVLLLMRHIGSNVCQPLCVRLGFLRIHQRIATWFPSPFLKRTPHFEPQLLYSSAWLKHVSITKILCRGFEIIGFRLFSRHGLGAKPNHSWNPHDKDFQSKYIEFACIKKDCHGWCRA